MNYSNSTVIRCLGGEGDFSILKRKNFFSRGIWAFKTILKLTYMLLVRSDKIKTKDLIYLCGVNQDRLLKSLDLNLYGIDSQYNVVWQPRSFYKKEKKSYVSVRFRCYLQMVLFCLAYVFTGNKRLVAAFLIKYFRGVSDFLNTNVINIERFICLNDQPFEAAALTLWARQQAKQTVVLQHGVILSYNYYFPTNSHEFWAWGENGRGHFKSKVKEGEYIVKGRLLKKGCSIPLNFTLPDRKNMKGAICPSFFHAEIIALIKLAGSIKGGGKVFYLKLHPSTKFKFFYRFLAFYYGLGYIDYRAPIFLVAEHFDFLVTKSSSAAVDFLLLGKLVFGIKTPAAHKEIFKNSLLSIEDMILFLGGREVINMKSYNKNRFLFIRDLIG